MTEAERLLREARAYLANLSINVIGNHCYEIVQQLDAYLARPEPQAVSGETPETDAMWRGKNIDLTQGVVPLSFARSLERRLRAAEEALDNAGVAKGAFGHSLRYRIGLLIERAEAAERRPSAEEVREVCLACCNPGSATDDISDDFHRGYMSAKRHVAAAIRSLDLSKVGGEGKK